MSPFDPLIVAGGVLLLLGVIGSKASTRLGIPAVLAFLVLGMLAGSEGPGGIAFDNVALAQGVGVVALAFILFAGGLDTRWDEVKPVAGYALTLATVGVVLTAAVAGVFSAWVLGLPLPAGLLLGAIVSSTDAAAVFSVLRSRGVSLIPRLKALLEMESGSNDPMAVLLTIALTSYVGGEALTAWSMAVFLVRQLVLGGLFGWAFAKVTIWTVNRIRLDYEGLYPVLTSVTVLLSYGVTAWVGGSGILAVYACGLVLGSADFVHKQSLREFHDGVAWFMQIVMFGALGLLVFPSQLIEITVPAMAVAAALVVIARPISVFLVLSRGWSLRERAMASWVGLRGSVPIVLATFPLAAGVDHANTIFNVVFFIVLSSVLIQGTSLPWVAKKLGVDQEPDPSRPRPFEYVRMASGPREPVSLRVAHGAMADGEQIVDLDLPDGTLIVMVTRGDDYVVPQGSTVLRGDDELLVVAGEDGVDVLRALCADPNEEESWA